MAQNKYSQRIIPSRGIIQVNSRVDHTEQMALPYFSHAFGVEVGVPPTLCVALEPPSMSKEECAAFCCGAADPFPLLHKKN